MASDVEIVNRALRLLKVEQISSLDEGTSQARWARDTYAAARDALLQEYPWNFAVRRATLAASTDGPDWGPERRFPLPADCLRVLNVEDEPEFVTDRYSIEDGAIVTDSDAPLRIRYVARVESAASFAPLFVEALVVKLAAEGAWHFTGSLSREAQLIDLFREKSAQARRFDAQEGTPGPGPIADDWLRSRY